jgi:multiple sugar transport system substrate-binding protein
VRKKQVKDNRINRHIIYSAIALLFFSGCSCRKDTDTSSNSDKVTLTYWCATNPDEITLATELVAKWNSNHPDIQVNLQPIPASKSSEEALLAAIAGGTTPDICSNIWPGVVTKYVSAGGLESLDQFSDFNEVLSERVPADLLDSVRSSDGHFYQIPWKTNPIMIMYNVKIFRQEGITKLPRTYSEYLEAAKKVIKDTDGDGETDQWMGYRTILPMWWERFFDYYCFYIAASGGKTLFNGDKINFENEASVKVMDFFQKIYKAGYFPLTTFQADPFLSGKIVTNIVGPWNITHVEKIKPPGLEYDIMPIPVPDDYVGPVYTYGDAKNIAIFSTTKHPKQAWEFVKFLISPESDLRLLQVTSQIPVRKNVTTDPLFAEHFKSNPRLAKFAEQVPYTRSADSSGVLEEVLDAISQEYEACAIYGVKTPARAIHDAAKRAKVIVEWNRSR